MQTVDYTYNIRGWLTQMNDSYNLGSDLFAMQLKYDEAGTGTKLRKEVYENGVKSLVKDYTGGFVYNGNTLDFLHTAEGRAKSNSAGSFTYEYYLKDHLGNTRVSFDETAAAIKQEDHYYPFGMRLGGDSWVKVGQADNKFLYNGKEFEDDLGLHWYHYGARFYDPQLGKWHAVDPVDELNTPYGYVGNNPIIYIDPDGETIENHTGKFYVLYVGWHQGEQPGDYDFEGVGIVGPGESSKLLAEHDQVIIYHQDKNGAFHRAEDTAWQKTGGAPYTNYVVEAVNDIAVLRRDGGPIDQRAGEFRAAREPDELKLNLKTLKIGVEKISARISKYENILERGPTGGIIEVLEGGISKMEQQLHIIQLEIQNLEQPKQPNE